MTEMQPALQRKCLLEFLQSDEPAWLDENHPELAEGAGVWVQKMREDSNRAL